MTKRFVVGLLIAFVVPLAFPSAASANTQNKIVFEIKHLKLTPNDIADMINGKKQNENTEPAQPEFKVEKTTAQVIAAKSSYGLPPKTIGDARVYMHEPEIRAYICPKLGDKCNIFIAVLKAENGTHECTRDNRGLNSNGSVDIGLAQINWRPGNPWHTYEQLQDCKYNLDVALEMYSRRGFQPWYAYTKGAYKKHLPAVLATAQTLEVQAAKEVAIATEPAPITN